VLVEALVQQRAVFRQTKWAETEGPESAFVRRIALAPALLGSLRRRIGQQRAFDVVKELLVVIGVAEQREHLGSLDVPDGGDMARLQAFNELMDRVGAPRFNGRDTVTCDGTTNHFRITRCVFYDFFCESGTPELTKAFCEVDWRFFSEAFPGLTFDRGDSWENTIAYGKPACEFVFRRAG
jgi:hypothetical protein